MNFSLTNYVGNDKYIMTVLFENTWRNIKHLSNSFRQLKFSASFYHRFSRHTNRIFLIEFFPNKTFNPPSLTCVNLDRKCFWHEIWHSHTLQCFKKIDRKNFKIATIAMMTSLIMSIFWKIIRKMAKICFFLKLTLWQLEKRFSRYFFSFWKSR